MALGTLLVIVGLVLAIVALFVPVYAVRLLCAALIISLVGVLVGVHPLL